VNHGLSLYLTVTVLVTGEPRSVIISNSNCLTWNTLPCQFEKCFGKSITHVSGQVLPMSYAHGQVLYGSCTDAEETKGRYK
jgi:hypothetical protein